MDYINDKQKEGNDILELLQDHHHSIGLCYPTLANGILLTGGSGAWELGSYIEIIPENTIAFNFDLHYLNSGVASATDTYEVHLFKKIGSNYTLICKTRTRRDTNQSPIISKRIMTPLIEANAGIFAKIASQTGGNDTLVVSIDYHHY